MANQSEKHVRKPSYTQFSLGYTIFISDPSLPPYFEDLGPLLFFDPLSPVAGDMTLSEAKSFDLAGAETVLSIGNAIGLVLPIDPLESPPIVSRFVDVDKSGVRFTELPDPTESIVALRWCFDRSEGNSSSSGMIDIPSNLEFTSLMVNDFGATGEDGVCGILNELEVLDRVKDGYSAIGLEATVATGAISSKVRAVRSSS